MRAELVFRTSSIRYAVRGPGGPPMATLKHLAPKAKTLADVFAHRALVTLEVDAAFSEALKAERIASLPAWQLLGGPLPDSFDGIPLVAVG